VSIWRKLKAIKENVKKLKPGAIEQVMFRGLKPGIWCYTGEKVQTYEREFKRLITKRVQNKKTFEIGKEYN
jgi:hypothetical protein